MPKRSPFKERVPRQANRKAAFDTLKADGWQLSTRGWPDYFGARQGGKEIAAFYVSTRRNLRGEQQEVAMILNMHGLPCFHVTLDGSTIPITGIRNFK